MLGWAGIQNGELLRKAREAGFEVLITMDGNMVHQQNIALLPIPIIALRAKSNRLQDTRPLMEEVFAHLTHSTPRTLTFIPRHEPLRSARPEALELLQHPAG